jgi:hypothetical protein
MRNLLLFLVAVLGLAANQCSDEVQGKKIGEPCATHGECASNLCTIPLTGDGGTKDSGLPPKRCVEPDVK